MKWYLIMALTFLVAGCGLREREQALQRKEAALNQKEQELLLKEKTLQLKEENLALEEKRLDSTLKKDSLLAYNPNLPGLWDVTMTCIETTCPGSAIGDTKEEDWIFQYEGNQILARAMNGNRLLRTYTGGFNNNTLEMVAATDTAAANTTASISVRLGFRDSSAMEGRREIIREGECKIIYSLQLAKK